MLTDADREWMFREGLYSLSEGLRMQAGGAADPWPAETVTKVRAYLRERLSQWRPTVRDGVNGAAQFDEGVRQLVLAALAEEEWYREQTARILGLEGA